MKRKMVRRRNCGNQYPKEGFKIRVHPYGIFTQCPISAIDKTAYNLYMMVKECNAIGMGGVVLRPSLFFSESNFYFEVRSLVQEVISEFEKIRKPKEDR